MRIYCNTCKEYVLQDSDDFVLDGPYHGGMFKGATGDRWRASMFDTREHVKGGDLLCPRCMGFFLGLKGELLTEHGQVYAGQKTLDTGFTIIHHDGPVKGQLAHIQDSRPATEKEAVPVPDEEGGPTLFEKTKGKCPKCEKQYKDSKWFKKHVEKCK